MNIKNVWGKIVLYLRENHQIALHVACGDISDVVIKDGRLIISVADNTVLSLLQDGKREIERALSWQGLDLIVDIEQKIIPPSKQEEDIKKLKQIFDDKLIIKK